MTTDAWPEGSETIEPLGPITVRVPATSANLGTGFDAAGVALQRYVTVTLSIATGGEDERSPMTRHVRKAAREVFRELGRERPDSELVEVTVDAEFPLGRGLGASAACRGAGLVAANALLGAPLSEHRILEIGSDLEGHADNMAPALFGGCQIVAMTGESVTRVALPVAEGLRFVGFTPSFNMSTKKGRALLPKQLSRKDAVHNSCRSALLVAALTTGSWDALKTATDDRLHQIPRSNLFPTMFELFEAAEAAGAFAAYLSGGGSTLMALANDECAELVSDAWISAAEARGISGQAFVSEIDAVGAQIL
ncbi:MAG: homoserine kinase [Chloroflexota bacterium]|nr:homoserine kinase [Chloroflexota bacterium]MDE2895464.1 homoserine kinase [Chloroflexota bacterium]